MNFARKIFCVFLLLWATSDVALAFKPSTEEYGHTMITKSLLSAGGYAFGAGNVVPQFTVGNVPFTPTAVEQIVLGAQSRDWSGVDGLNCYGGLNALTSVLSVACFTGRDGDYKDIVVTGDLALADAHFDADNFAGSADAIHRLIRGSVNWEGVYYYGFAGSQFPVSYPGLSVIDLLKRYVSEVASKGAPTLAQRQMLMVARIKLGKALHTLQDFYAHSTWADIYGADKIFLPVTDNLVNAVSKPNFSGFTLASAHSHADEGWNGDVCKARDPADAPTWAENGGNWEWQTLPAVTSLGVVSSSAWDLLTAVTTGAASDKLGYSRCDHGSDWPKTVSGIAKDAPYMPFDSATHCTAENSCAISVGPASGHYTGGRATAALKSTPSHLVASQQAALHSVELLNKLIYIIRNDATIATTPAQAERMVSELLGATEPVPRIAFVVDASGSMSNIIPGISAGLGLGANTSGKSLITYDAVGTQTLVSERLDQMQALLASAGNGGTSCETPALSVLLKVVNELPAHSSVYLFTDAGASDADQLSAVGAAAVARNIRINPVVFGGCGLDEGATGPVTASTKVYAELRNRTGGRSYSGLPDQAPAQTLFAALLAYEAILSQAGPRQSAALVRSSTASAAAATAATSITSPGVLLVEGGVLADDRSVYFSVDGGLSQLIVTVSAAGAKAHLAYLGNPARDSVALTDSGGGMLYTSVPNPAAGNWALWIYPVTPVPYSAQVEVRGGVVLKDLQYESLVEIGTRSGHEYAPSLGSTPSSGASMAKVQIDGATGTSVTLSYVNEGGAVIGSYPLTLVSSAVFMGKVTVPTSAYWVKVTGQGQDGSSFARMWRGEHPLPEPMQGGRVVVQALGSAAWVPGQTGRASVSLTNLGADEVLTLSARSNFGNVAVTPNTITLAAHTRASAELSVLVPATASVGASAGLVLTITRAGGSREIEIPITIQAAPVAVLALTVSRAGTGTGTVTSTPAGITCGSTCSASFNTGTIVTLTATPAAGSTFSGWSGACSGSGSCVVTLDAVKSVSANFVALAAPPVCTLTASPATITPGASSTLTASCSPTATAYSWTGGTCAGTTAATCNVSPSATTTYTVAGVNAGGTGAAAITTVTVTPASTKTYTINTDGTVTDPTTGLTWMRCSMGQTWTGSTCSGTANTYTFDQALALNNTISFASKTDWRMPNIRELQTIVDRTRYSPAIDTGAFPNTPDSSLFFWSGTPLNSYAENAWAVYFAGGDDSPNVERNNGSGVARLVRGGGSGILNLARPDTDYVDHGDGTVTHAPTGLMWQRCAVGKTWAGGTCSGQKSGGDWESVRLLTSTFAGKTDWRLPTAEELLSLVDYSRIRSAINTALFPNTDSLNFWSSAARANNPDYAWTVEFSGGVAYTSHKTDTYTVRFVRSGQALASLSLAVSKTGSGTVTSSAAGIDCGSICSAQVINGARVSLTATPAVGATFIGWGGACSGSDSCFVTMDAAKSVAANFTVAPALPACTLTASPATITAGESTTLTASCSPAATAYIWSGGTCWFNTAATCTVTPVTTTTYTVAGVNVVGTGAEASVTLTPASTKTYTIHTDGTVTDPTTGLTWMRCSMGQTWTGSTCSGTANSYTFDQALALNNTVTFASKADWRMPNIRELQTIVERALFPAIDAEAFPNAPHSPQFFWSGTPNGNFMEYAWAVYFAGGHDNAFVDPKSGDGVARLVRGGQSLGLLNLARPSTDYVDHSDGTATHAPTGLMWQRCAVGQVWAGGSCSGSISTMNWDAAKLLSSNLAGKTDWRLPTEEELLSLVDYSGVSPAINAALFPNTDFLGYWSGSPRGGDSGSAWTIFFGDGQAWEASQGDAHSVRFVRSGQPLVSLALAVSKTGTGTVTSSPAGISCGSTCSAQFFSGTRVTLTATPAAGNAFTGWSGACSGSGSCVVALDAAKSVSANFAVAAAPPVCTLSASPASVAPGASSTLTASCSPAATSYVWTGGTCAGTSATCRVTPTVPTTYTVVGSNAGGASATASTTVSLLVALGKPVCTLTASPNSIVSGGSSTLTATCNPAATTYVWTGGNCGASMGPTCAVTQMATTTYTVAGINPAGTGNATNAVVSVAAAGAPICTLSAAPVVVSSGGVSRLTATCTPPATSYAWSPSGLAATASSGTVAPVVPTVFSVTGTNAAGRGNQASAAVYVCNTVPTENYQGLVIGGSNANAVIGSGIASDTIDGGPGFDTVIYQCNRDAFTLTKTSSGWTVSSKAEGLDTLTNVERIKFGNETLALDISGVAGQAYRIYQAAFNRVPDNGGLKYWIGQMDAGMSQLEVAARFVDSDEFRALYGANPTNAEFLTRLYSNVLHRTPDQGGYDWWLGELNAGRYNKVTALAGFSESPENQAGVLNAIINGIDLLN